MANPAALAGAALVGAGLGSSSSSAGYSSPSCDYTATGADALRLYAAAGGRHGPTVTKVRYLFRPLLKEYKYTIHAVWDRDFWRNTARVGLMAGGMYLVQSSRGSQADPVATQRILEDIQAEFAEEDWRAFVEGAEQNPLDWRGFSTLQNLHTALYIEFEGTGKMVLEFNVQGITVSVDTQVKLAATERLRNFASAGIDFDIPPAHQFNTYQLIQRYLNSSSALQYDLLTWNCQCWTQELYCNILRGTEFLGNKEAFAAFFRWNLCTRWDVRCPYQDADIFRHGQQLRPDPAQTPAESAPEAAQDAAATEQLLTQLREQLMQYMPEDLARQRVADELARLDGNLTAEERRTQLSSLIWRLHSEFDPIVPMAARSVTRRHKPRLLVLDYEFDRRYKRALWDDFDIKYCQLPDFRGLTRAQMALEEEKMRLAIVQHTCEDGRYLEAEAVVCASYGGHYMVHLWQLMAAQPERFPRLPCLMINAYPGMKTSTFGLPEDVPIVIAHGLRDDQFEWEWGLNEYGTVQRARRSNEHSLSSVIRTGTPGYTFLYHTGEGRVRDADGHYCESLGRAWRQGTGARALPRLVESLMTSSYSEFTPFRPEARFLVSASALTNPARVAAEIRLGYHPVALQRFWPAAAAGTPRLPLRMDVARDSPEWEHVCAIFKGEPEGVPRYYHTQSTRGMRIEQIERVQNRDLLQHSILSHDSIRTNLLEGGIVLEGGSHVRYLWHGTSSYATLGRMVADPLQAFNVALAGANVGARWGRGAYFARDAAYSVPYCEECLDAEGRQVMLLCLVEVGLSTIGAQHLRNLPSREPGQRYHSFIDSASNPEIFVVQSSTQIYPAYVVHFRP